MNDADTLSHKYAIHVLWERLTREVGQILDVHGVCAAVAYETAQFSGVSTVVAIKSSTFHEYYDVWICDEDGRLQQKRWHGNQESLDQLAAAEAADRRLKVDLPASEVMNSDLWPLVQESVLFAPLPHPQRPRRHAPPGALCLIDPPQNCVIDVSNVEPLATFITTFLERAYLRQETDRQRVEFDTVYDLTYSLTASLRLENIFSQLTDPVRRTLNVETILVGLTDPQTGEIEFVDTLMDPEFRGLPSLRIKPGQGIAGQVAKTGDPLIVNDAYRDERVFKGAGDMSDFRTHSLLCVPLKIEHRVIGVLEAVNKQQGDFNQDDLRLLQAITGPLAAAIENARLHEDVIAEKRRQETIFAGMSEGALTVTAQGTITAANDSLLTLVGQESEEALVDRPASEVINLRSKEDFAAFMERVLAADSREKPEITGDLLREDGNHAPVHISGAPIHDEEGKTNEMIFVFTDLRQIREVERMRDDFFHNIVHEIRTPLATILMYARLLREGKAQGDEAKEDRFLGVIERESDRLQQMVRQMLQLAKLEAGEVQRSAELVDLVDLMEEILPPLAERAVQKGLTFTQRIPDDLPQLMGSKEMMHSVFKNLVENAVKFTLSGTVRVEASARDGAVQIVVQDEGIGIPSQAQPNLFKRFYRAQTAVEQGIAGSGLGLYMVKEAVERHQGTISVDSTEGQGTTFTVNLPTQGAS